MKSPSFPLLRYKQAACLGASLLLAGSATTLFARGAAPMAPPIFIADIDLNIMLEAPPPPRHEVIVERERPSRDHVWVNGYWMNRRGHHEWIPGRWEVPPRGRTVWIEPRWERRGRGYAFIQGYWSDRRPDGRHDDHDHGHDRDHDHDRH